MVSPACAAAVAESAQGWLSPAVLQPLTDSLAAARQRSEAPPAAGGPPSPTTGGADQAAAAQLGAVAAVLHFLASYGETAKLRREDLFPLRAAVAASAVLDPAAAHGGGVHPLLTAALEALSSQRSAVSAAAGAELLDAALALRQALQRPGQQDSDTHVASAVSRAVLPEVCGIQLQGFRIIDPQNPKISLSLVCRVESFRREVSCLSRLLFEFPVSKIER